MKKLVLLLCVCLIIIGLVACADEKTGAESTDGTENHTIESESQTEPVTELPEESETVPEAIPETEPITEPETALETKKEVTPNEYATFVECEWDKNLSNLFYVVNSRVEKESPTGETYYARESSVRIYDYDINYELVAGGRYYKGTFILPEGYENGYVFYVESNEEKTLFSAFVCAEKDGKAYYFEYVFNMDIDTDKPIALNTVGIEKVEEIIAVKNKKSGDIFDSNHPYDKNYVFGKYEITLPISFSGYYIVTARVVYVEDENELTEAVAVCNSGFARAFYYEECAGYTAGMPYETVRYHYVAPTGTDESYAEGAKRMNNRDFFFMSKLDDHYYVYTEFRYKDDNYNPPDDYEEQLVSILKEMKVEYTIN
ncbi:MAG: hypothetical protein IJN17_02125 [Clostridia bacterium]|nr:hypothetical protein [Clostridia bacterium]